MVGRRKPTRAERRRRHFERHIDSAPTERDRLWLAVAYLRSVLVHAADEDEADQTAARIAAQARAAADSVRTKERR